MSITDTTTSTAESTMVTPSRTSFWTGRSEFALVDSRPVVADGDGGRRPGADRDGDRLVAVAEPQRVAQQMLDRDLNEAGIRPHRNGASRNTYPQPLVGILDGGDRT